MSSQMMLLWLGEKQKDPSAVQAARDIETAVDRVLSESNAVTPDMGGTAKTEEMGEAICEAVAETNSGGN